MTYAQFVAALRAEGLTVIEHPTGGRSPADHNRNHKGPWGPVHGVLVHHTVTSGHDRTIDICRAGHADLPGPLCDGVICKAGHVHAVGYGRTNHAGAGDGKVLQAVIAEQALPRPTVADTDGNRYFYGFECENLGDGQDPWPAAQLQAIERAAAAVCRHHGWTERSVIGHLEWQPGKVDPRGFSMSSMRGSVATRLTRPAGAGGTTTSPSKEAPVAQLSKADVYDAVWGSDRMTAPAGAADVKANPHWQPQSYLRSIYNAVAGLPGVVAALRKDVAALRADIAALKKEN
ncbi:N-acetylmuramoyl-L-alanine amidase [Streptomyces sp. SID8352]|nr:N-acetylmuramoyl-L-alanine amidase [Streptomyces sp. SID8352]